jgi:hypothetical protein
MTNQAVVASLLADPVPTDRECVLTATDVVNLVQDYVRVVGLASQISSPGGVGTPVTNNSGQQALLRVQALEASVAELQGMVVERRVIAVQQNVPSGDSYQTFTILPEMPDSNYVVHLNYVGSATHPAAYYGWRVVAGSQATNQFQLSFENTPSATTVTVWVEQLKTVEAPTE